MVSGQMDSQETGSTTGPGSQESPANCAVNALLPFLILLLFAGLGHNFSAPSESAGAQEVPFQNNPFPLIVQGLAYLLVLGIVRC